MKHVEGVAWNLHPGLGFESLKMGIEDPWLCRFKVRIQLETLGLSALHTWGCEEVELPLRRVAGSHQGES